MCKDLNLFTESHQVESGVQLASDSTAPATARGDVRVLTSNHNKNKSILLQDTLHVPSLRTNLLSVSKIVDNGCTVTFNKKGAYIKNLKGKVRLVAEREGDLFFLRGQTPAAHSAEHQPNSIEEWHRRLGHLNLSDMRRMLRSKSVSGLNFADNAEPLKCNACAAGKMTCAPFPKCNVPTSARLEIVHTDVCGPMRTTSHGGARYFLTFTDGHSRHTDIFLLKNKSEVASKFIQYKNLVETQTGLKIKALQSDNGREFCNTEMDRILQAAGIQRRLTAPYTPQQNGVAERKNRTLVEAARSMLAESGLPNTFWGEAISTANYVRNRCLTKILGTQTPYEIWTGKRPNVNHLKSFGVKVHYLDKSIGKDKLSPRGIEGIFVGYCQNAKAYRVWVPSERKVRITRDVVFSHEFPLKSLADDSTTSIEAEFLPTTEVKEPSAQDIIDGNISKIRHDDSEVPSSLPIHNDKNIQEAEDISKRTPGRPRFVRTGKPGRPSKQYQHATADSSIQDNVVKARDEDYSSDEDFKGWENPNVAMNAIEIQLQNAMSGPHCDDWKQAIYSEVKSLMANNAFDLVDRPANKNVIKSRTVLRNKLNSNGEIERRKARIVAKGFSQCPGVDFFETFAPVARLSSLRLLLALAVKLNLKISQLDIETAYLNGPIDAEIYMEQPELFAEMVKIAAAEKDPVISKRAQIMVKELSDGKSKVCKLNKALYGLRQAGRQWYSTLNKVLKNIGLTPTNADPCVYVDSSKFTYVFVYVDDILIFSNHKARESLIKQELAKFFRVKDLGDARFCLGFEIRHEDRSIHLSQSRYIKEVIQKFNMADCKPAGTPRAAGATFVNNDRNDTCDNRPYRELIGSLMYISLGTRPDITHTVSMLSQFNSCPRQEHWIAAKRVLRYLRGTSNMALVFHDDEKPLTGYVDADWANCQVDRRSYTGSAFILSGAAISWESRKQRTVALSSTEAEYMAVTDATKEAIHLIQFMKDLGLDRLARIILYNDNQGAGMLSQNPVFHARSKHIDVKHHFVRQALKIHPIKLIYLPTDRMIADVLTKSLPRPKHIELSQELGLHPKESQRAQVVGEC